MKSNVTKIKLILSSCLLVYSAAGVAEPTVAPVPTVAAPQNVQPSTSVEEKKIVPLVFAKVDDVEITFDDFYIDMSAAARKKFYHGRAPAGELAALQREVGNTLVANVLLVKEAKRRGLKPNQTETAKRLELLEQRNKTMGGWEENRAKYLPKIIKRLDDEDLLIQLEALVRKVPEPKEEQVREYYTKNPDKFTEPVQMRVSLILLPVDPGAPSADWIKANEDATALVKQLKEGADFAKIATERSGDAASAKLGGDMGYLHMGMLPDTAQVVLDTMKVKEISEPIRLLEGISIFKLTERSEAKLSSFDTVKARASDLWLKEEAERVWKQLIVDVKKNAVIHIDESYFEPLEVVSTEPEKKEQKETIETK